MEQKSKKQMRRLLRQKLTAEETLRLSEEGFHFANPTRETLILVALYKKAAGGDMNAMREIRTMTGEISSAAESGVQIIDNVPDKDS